MKVVLFDLDLIKRRRAFPNLALMKLSAFHRARGDEVFFNFLLPEPDKIYVSCVFPWNAKKANNLFPPGTIMGGSGLDLHLELLPEVEHIMPDYGLYPGVNFSLGFTSRGCFRRCPWCIVPEKEGAIKPWASIYEFWDRSHRKIVLLDNNLLAAANWQSTLAALIATGVEVDFNQGLDIRLVNEETVGFLKRIKTRQLRFAFDDIAYESAVRKGIKLLLDSGINSRKLSFYVLIGFGDDDTAVERIKILHSYNVDIYPMAYKGPDGKEPLRSLIGVGETTLWHGSRRNINKFLRLVGRLPE